MLRALKHLIETRFNKGQVKQNTHKSCSFLIVSLSKSLSLCFMCSDQHVKYRMPRGSPLTSSLLLDYHVKQYARTHILILLSYFTGGCQMICNQELICGHTCAMICHNKDLKHAVYKCPKPCVNLLDPCKHSCPGM